MTAPSIVIRFSPDTAQCVRAGESRYVLMARGMAPDSHTGASVVSAQCPHRGGPLHLGTWTADGSAVTCPMHGLATSAACLRRTQLPTIDRGDEVVVVLPAAAGPAIAFRSPLQGLSP